MALTAKTIDIHYPQAELPQLVSLMRERRDNSSRWRYATGPHRAVAAPDANQEARAIDEVSKLPATEQDAMAILMLEELASEQRWDKAFADSADVLARLGDEAVAEHRRVVEVKHSNLTIEH